jgi:hypothetical protein
MHKKYLILMIGFALLAASEVKTVQNRVADAAQQEAMERGCKGLLCRRRPADCYDFGGRPTPGSTAATSATAFKKTWRRIKAATWRCYVRSGIALVPDATPSSEPDFKAEEQFTERALARYGLDEKANPKHK